MKVDRLISINLAPKETVDVPKGEMWKLMPFGATPNVNSTTGAQNIEFIVVENDRITTYSSSPLQLSGLAFTI